MRLLSIMLAFIFFMNTLPYVEASSKNKSQEDVLLKLENLSNSFEKHCISSKVKNVEAHLKSYGLSESCWKLLTEINHLERQLTSLHPELVSKISCPTCSKDLGLPEITLPQLPLNQELTCSAEVRKRNLQQCPNDLACALYSSLTTLPGTTKWIGSPEKILPKGIAPTNCTPGDSCTNQIITAFYDAVLNFFSASWDLLKMAGGFAKDQLVDFWNWVTGPEDASSAAQLALAQASEDEGLFQMLKNDFTGTISNIFQGLITSVKEWLKNDILCERWSGVPHRSTCLAPAKGFDCISCKSTLNGICAISGVFVAEILPAFITGGLTTAAKHGAGAASRLLKTTFKVSDKSIQAIKNSKTLKASLGIISKMDDFKKTSVVLAKINQYLISPARKVAQVTLNVLSAIVRNSKVYMAETAKGKYIVFAQDGLKLTGKVVLYPIENNLTMFAFRAGQQTFDKVFKLAAPTLTNKSSVAIAVTAHTPQLDSVLTKIEIAHLKKQKTLQLEREQVKILQGKRSVLTKKALEAKNPKLNEVIRTIYPELNYGELARNTPRVDLLKREKELYMEISKIKDPNLKKRMMNDYQRFIVDSNQRKTLLKDQPNYKEIVDNSQLSPLTRGARGVQHLGKMLLSKEQRIKLEAGIRSANASSWDKKKQILINSGFTDKEAQKLMDFGFVGLPPN